jgi:hypothetical protein
MATIKATVRKEDDGNLLLVFKNSKGTEPYYECFDGGGHCDLELFYLTKETKPVRSSDPAAIAFSAFYENRYHAQVELTTLSGLVRSTGITRKIRFRGQL